MTRVRLSQVWAEERQRVFGTNNNARRKTDFRGE